MLSKLLLVSILVASIILPFLSAKEVNPERGLRLLVFRSVLLMVSYGLALRFVYPRL